MVEVPKIARIKATSGAVGIIRSQSLFFDGKVGVLASFLVKASSVMPGPITVTLTLSEPLPNEPFAWAVLMGNPMTFSSPTATKLGTDEISVSFVNRSPMPREILFELFVVAY